MCVKSQGSSTTPPLSLSHRKSRAARSATPLGGTSRARIGTPALCWLAPVARVRIEERKEEERTLPSRPGGRADGRASGRTSRRGGGRNLPSLMPCLPSGPSQMPGDSMRRFTLRRVAPEEGCIGSEEGCVGSEEGCVGSEEPSEESEGMNRRKGRWEGTVSRERGGSARESGDKRGREAVSERERLTSARRPRESRPRATG